ncbi:hypothetical protein J6590_002491 [Homalodisca vitripennis]|nr:hypothetical protein J6590_002491 [Homalodisca vitripennis]
MFGATTFMRDRDHLTFSSKERNASRKRVMKPFAVGLRCWKVCKLSEKTNKQEDVNSDHSKRRVSSRAADCENGQGVVSARAAAAVECCIASSAQQSAVLLTLRTVRVWYQRVLRRRWSVVLRAQHSSQLEQVDHASLFILELGEPEPGMQMTSR